MLKHFFAKVYFFCLKNLHFVVFRFTFVSYLTEVLTKTKCFTTFYLFFIPIQNQKHNGKEK